MKTKGKKKTVKMTQSSLPSGLNTPLKKCNVCQAVLYDDKDNKLHDNMTVLESTPEIKKILDGERVSKRIFAPGDVKIKHEKCGATGTLGSGERCYDEKAKCWDRWPIFSITWDNKEEIIVKLWEKHEAEEKQKQDNEMAKAQAEAEEQAKAEAEAQRQKEIEKDRAAGNYAGEGGGWTDKEKRMFDA
jgi:hypothetical protein